MLKEKEQVWEVGDFVKENFQSSPDRNKAYKILDINEDRIYYDRFDNCFSHKDNLQLIKANELFSKTTTECQSEEWQPKCGEEVEVSEYDNPFDWEVLNFIGINNFGTNIRDYTKVFIR